MSTVVHATFHRAPRDCDQGEPVEHDFVQHDGSIITSYHPDAFVGTNLIAWCRADNMSFATSGPHAYLLTTTRDGDSGLLSTFLNTCVSFNSMASCYNFRCKMYHQPLGKVMSNLPKRYPKCLGDIAPAIRAVKGVSDLLEWSDAQVLTLFKKDERHLKDMEYQSAEIRQLKQARDNQRARFITLEADLAGAPLLTDSPDRKRPLALTGPDALPARKVAKPRPVPKPRLHRLPYIAPTTAALLPHVEEAEASADPPVIMAPLKKAVPGVTVSEAAPSSAEDGVAPAEAAGEDDDKDDDLIDAVPAVDADVRHSHDDDETLVADEDDPNHQSAPAPRTPPRSDAGAEADIKQL